MGLIRYLLAILLIISMIWALSKLIKSKSFHVWVNGFYVLMIFLLLLEVSLNVMFRIESGTWLFKLHTHPNKLLFDNHPYLSVTNKKSIDVDFYGVHIEHNSLGQRSPEYNSSDYSTKTRIVTIGGSTTYGVGVDNDKTWPYILSQLMGEDTVVINLAVPGHSTIENLITESLYLDEINPDIILLHVGLNDLRVSNVNNLESDYSNFHEPNLVGSMGLCYLENVPKIATLYYAVRVMQKLKIYPICDFHVAKVSGEIKMEPDKKALTFYRNNLKKLIHMATYYTNDIYIIPQILVDDRVKEGGLTWWIPFVPASSLVTLVETYNMSSKEVVVNSGGFYINEVDDANWDTNDFTDPSHLNANGNLKLAEIIKKSIQHRKHTD